MQATPTVTAPSRFGRNLSYFLLAPLTAFVLITLALAVTIAGYESRHNGRIYTGVSVWGVDLGGLTPDEAAAALRAAFPYPQEAAITLTDPVTGDQWQQTPADFGLSFDVDATIAAAYAVGREGGVGARLRTLFDAWYAGQAVAPVVIFDEGQLDAGLAALAGTVNQAPVNAQVDLQGTQTTYAPGRFGRQLDVGYLRARLVEPMTDFRQADVQLLIHDTPPALLDDTAIANEIRQVTASPMYFYLQEPLENVDLGYVELPPAELNRWLRVELTEQADGSRQHALFIDENAARAWLAQYADQVYREPTRARFYFDDDTRELVLVAPHVNGRQLDVDATIDRLMQQVLTADRHVPFILEEIVPTVSAGATAAELGITELITETTTWFYGSSDERKHNIARAAANFFGIVVAPGEEFSFNHYLGTVSEADGYEEGFIIINGATVQGVGGGVCQVSTTLYQTAFLAGFPIVERWEHGYMVGYYNDGQGPGMDATVFSPIVDFRFINNTPHHLLIENYYNEEFEALTFKFYSTGMGRTVVKEGPDYSNVTEVPGPELDRWEFNPDLPSGTVQQVDWATEGATVSVRRIVYNASGDLIDDQYFISNYVPIPNLFQYGPDVEPFDYSLVPEE